MKQLLFIISFGFRLLIFSLVFGSIILQPMVESLYGSERQAFSWLDLDTENDSSKKESQETKEFKESKNKKVELQFINEEETMFKLEKKASIFGLDFSKMEVTIDTNDPPPELI
jgi:hypothetical protein